MKKIRHHNQHFDAEEKDKMEQTPLQSMKAITLTKFKNEQTLTYP
jgi:hypothetical protein